LTTIENFEFGMHSLYGARGGSVGGGLAIDGTVSDMDVTVLALDDVFDSGLAVVCDTLATANELAHGPRPYRITVAGVRRRVRTSHGLAVPVVPPPRRPELVIVPALGCKTPDTLTRALERADVADACAQLVAWRASGARIAGACTATWVLAQAGMLDGRRATTTWWLGAAFRARYPAVELTEDRMVVDAGGVVTAAAALAHVDLALWLVRRKSPSLAHATASHLVYETQPSQAAFAIPDHVAHDDAVVARFEDWARRHLGDFTMTAAARAAGASERTLERRIRRVLGKSPVTFVQDLRVEAAVHRLRTTDESLDQIAARVGYEEGSTLRAVIRRRLGRGVRELRRAS
jgi:transcriptional regulator GlxA family with amidase domain